MEKLPIILIKEMINLKLILLALTIWGSITSCKSVIKKQNINEITIELTECGSYKVKNNEAIIGYVVKPFVVEVDRVKKIKEFEWKLNIKHNSKFNKDYRAYTFKTDRAGDTILMTSFLSPKQVKNFPVWKCELLDVNAYPKNLEWVDYNCSKNRFKAPGDPD